MNEFEVRANNIVTAIETAKERIESFGYEEDPPEYAVSRLVGMFVTWLTACEEARHTANNPNASFKRNVIQSLPNEDDPNWENYIEPPPESTLRARAEALWGIRIAFTHADGDINLISDMQNKAFAINSANIFDSVTIVDNKLIIDNGLFHDAIRTIVQIQDLYP